MIVELKKGILYVNNKRFRWWMIWHYPEMIVFAHLLNMNKNISELFK